MRGHRGAVLGTTLVVCLVGCASRGPAFEAEVVVAPRSAQIVPLIEEYLEDAGYEVTERVERSISVTLSALKIRPGRDAGALLYDWLYVTVSRRSGLSGDRGFVVGVRGESEVEDRERRTVEPSAAVVREGNRLVAWLRTVR
jgi:hypothetical protein